MKKTEFHKSDSTEEDDIVLLTGAGASAYIGLRTLESIIDQKLGINSSISETIQNIWKRVKAIRGVNATFEEVLGKLYDYLNSSMLLKYDYVFNKALGSGVLTKVTTGEFERIWKNAIIECYLLMIDCYGPQKVKTDETEFKTSIKLIKKIASINGNRLHVFTTNYDCAFQKMSEVTDELYFLSHINNEGNFKEEWFIRNQHINGNNIPLIYIHRLHGCVAWFSTEERNSGLTELRNVDKINTNYLTKKKMIIKLITTEEIGKNPAFNLAYTEFHEKLLQCKLLIVWGHSFRDTEVLRTIIRAIESTKKNSFEILYIDPYLEEKDAVKNIFDTLSKIPGRKVKECDINPKRIPWDLYADPKTLISETKKMINRIIK